MKRSGTYLAGSLAIVGVSLLVARALLSPPAWAGLGWAGVAALGVQAVLFLALARVRRDPKRFAVGVVAGAATRMGVLIVAIVALSLSPRPGAVPFLLGLATFLVALLIFESVLENLDLLRPRAAQR